MTTRPRSEGHILAIIGLAAGAALLVAGFVRAEPADQSPREILTRLLRLPAEPTMKFDLGSFSLLGIRALTRLAGEEDPDEDLEALEALSGIKVAVWERGVNQVTIPPDSIRAIVAALRGQGWELFIKVHEKDEEVLIFYKPSLDSVSTVNAMVLLAIDQQEAVILDLQGNLRQLLEGSIRDKGKSICQFSRHD